MRQATPRTEKDSQREEKKRIALIMRIRRNWICLLPC